MVILLSLQRLVKRAKICGVEKKQELRRSSLTVNKVLKFISLKTFIQASFQSLFIDVQYEVTSK